MTDDERMRVSMEILREVGFERGTPASPDQIARAKKLAKEKGLDPDLLAARLATPGGRGRRGGDGGGGSGGSGRRTFGGGGGGGGVSPDRGFNNTVVQRNLYRLVDPNALEKKIEQVSVRLGVSDGFYTEVLDGLSEGDIMIKGVTLPGAVAAGSPSGGMQNPFQSSSRYGGMRGR
jgi:hypothetical protein